ncbi:MAG: hypothetical protein WC889_04800 [Myxococcota bacterium]|jgi:hypothetical protein
MRKIARSFVPVALMGVLVVSGCGDAFKGCGGARAPAPGQVQDAGAKPGPAAAPAAVGAKPAAAVYVDCDKYCGSLLACEKNAMSMKDCLVECSQLKLYLQDGYVQNVYACMLGCATQNNGQGNETCMEKAFSGCQRPDDLADVTAMVCDKAINCKLIDGERDQCISKMGGAFEKSFLCLNRAGTAKMLDCMKNMMCPNSLSTLLQSCFGKIFGR